MSEIDVISLSSDEECESPPTKRIKTSKESSNTIEVLKKLNKLTEITTRPCEDKIVKTVTKTTNTEENSLTIVISNQKIKEAEDNVVNLIDESQEEIDPKPKNQNGSSDCLVIGSASEGEDNTEIAEEPTPPRQENEVAENGALVKVDLEENITRPSTSKASESHQLFDEFLEVCASSLKGSKYEDKVLPKFTKIRKNFNNCENIYDEPNLKSMLQQHTKTARLSAPEAVISFQRIYSYLLDNLNGISIEVPEENLALIKKLEKTCTVLMKKLKKLDETEVNFDDEEDSVYMQTDRYAQRLDQVYKKYCKLINKNPYAGRLFHEKIQFVSSKYNEINRAMTKLCKNNDFPTYYDVEKCIRKSVSKNNLSLSEGDIRAESRDCFLKMGNLLQMRRKKELYEVHCGFIALVEDPATKDQDLKNKLQESAHQAEKGLKEVVDKYVRLQENNVSVELSEDSDDSHYKNSESDN
ncbi:hypothetical protein MTP99_002325 [Tenebrio molitor]|jgi:hypothetical protein|uniref:death domain-associated protein 6-like isoform X1 n=1 Tax=Tenebrio molitor TaxID=7067 RepID=UPI00270A4FB6|nr:hypothetical protein MTP99_002325 [Tenebrio molitor]